MKGFTIYSEYYDLITLLPTKKEQEEVTLAILRYMFEGVETELSDRAAKVFKNLKRPLDKSKEQSNRRIKNKISDSDNETNSKPNENQNETNSKPNENQNETNSKPNENTTMLSNVNVYVKDNRVIGEEEKELLNFIEKQEILLTPPDYERLKYFIDKLELNEIEDALLSGKGKSFNYSMSILRSKKNNKVTNSVPVWFDKKTKKQKMDEETRKEMEDFFKNYE